MLKNFEEVGYIFILLHPPQPSHALRHKHPIYDLKVQLTYAKGIALAHASPRFNTPPPPTQTHIGDVK